MLDYVEVYQKPHRIMRSFDDKTTIDELREPLIKMFDRLELERKILWKASMDSVKARMVASRQLM